MGIAEEVIKGLKPDTGSGVSLEQVETLISAAIQGLIAGAPTVLDTINELAQALGEDPNASATIFAAIDGLNVRMDLQDAVIAAKADLVGGKVPAAQLPDFLPIGTIVEYAGDTAPTGWFLCDGSEVSATTYAALAVVVGTKYGSAAAGKVRLPDLRGRVTVAAGQGSGLSNRTLAASGGEESHALTGTEAPTHTHDTSGIGAVGNYQAGTGGTRVQVNTTTYTANGSPHNNMQPFLVLNKIIKAL